MDLNNEEFYVGRAVTSLQTMLRVIAAQNNSLPTVVPDGIYGPQTVRAVTAFQRQAGLPATGVTDYPTWKAIRKAYAPALVEAAPAAPLDIVMQPNQVIGPGSDNLHVLLIQAMLHSIHQVYGNVPDCSMSGISDPGTVQAIKALQHSCGRPESGIMDKGLWQLLTGLYTQAVGDGDREKVCPKSEK